MHFAPSTFLDPPSPQKGAKFATEKGRKIFCALTLRTPPPIFFRRRRRRRHRRRRRRRRRRHRRRRRRRLNLSLNLYSLKQPHRIF